MEVSKNAGAGFPGVDGADVAGGRGDAKIGQRLVAIHQPANDRADGLSHAGGRRCQQ